jgi:hypothetical protein
VSEALDHWLPEWSVRTYHRRAAPVPRDALWSAAATIRLSDTRRLGRLVSWRIPGLHGSQTYHEMFHAYPFTVLQETNGTLVSGLCGKIWTLARDYPALADADAFADWHEPGTVRVAFAHWAEQLEDGRSQLVSEARVHPVDTTARLRLKAIWAVLGPFERLVGAEPLELAARRACADKGV